MISFLVHISTQQRIKSIISFIVELNLILNHTLMYITIVYFIFVTLTEENSSALQFTETNRNLLLKTHYVWREGKDQYIKWFVSISASKKQCEKKCTTCCIFCNETFFVYSRLFLNKNDRWTSQEKREFFTIIRRRLINLSSTNSQVLNALCKLEGHVSKMMSDSEKKGYRRY